MHNSDKQPNDSSQEPIIIYEKISKKGDDVVVRKYTRGKVLGKGGFATCYELTDIDASKLFAAKIISKASLTKKRALEKLLAEIKIHKSLHHEHIVQFERVFEDKENVYILLEICPNQTLKELLKKRKRIPEPECALYVAQTISALKYLHYEKKIIHRDLKLGNLLLGDSYNIKVADFGLAAKIEHEGEKRRTICGTPNYIAPEVLDKKQGHSYEVDIWSLGVICYTLIIGRPPFETNDTKATYRKIMKNNYSFPSNVIISEEAKDLIKKILVLEPTARPSLDEILQHPFIRNYANKPTSTQGSFIQKPTTLQTLISPNIALSLPSDRNTNPTSQGRDSALEKNVFESDIKPNLAYSEKLEEKGISSGIIKPQTITDAKIKYAATNGFDQRSHNYLQTYPAEINRELSPIIELDVHVTKWIDYSTKYGLGYLLSDGTAGMVFNDGTRITLSSDETRFEYMRRKVDQQREILSIYSPTNYPQELQKKVLLLKHFKEYLHGDTSNDDVNGKGREQEEKNSEASVKSTSLIYVKKWMKTKHAAMFRLSNKLIQVDFEDKTQIILNSLHQVVYYRNKKGHREQYPLTKAMELDYPEMVKRLKYTKEILIYIRQTSKDNNAGEPGSNKNKDQIEPQFGVSSARDGVTERLPQMNIYHGMHGVGENERGKF